MLLFSINRSRGYENPSLDNIVIELCSTRGCPLEEAREHCFQIQSVISVIIVLSFQCYCGECSGYIVVILPLLAFYFFSTYILYLVYYKNTFSDVLMRLSSSTTLNMLFNYNSFQNICVTSLLQNLKFFKMCASAPRCPQLVLCWRCSYIISSPFCIHKNFGGF
jgi:hypothetical protein